MLQWYTWHSLYGICSQISLTWARFMLACGTFVPLQSWVSGTAPRSTTQVGYNTSLRMYCMTAVYDECTVWPDDSSVWRMYCMTAVYDACTVWQQCMTHVLYYNSVWRTYCITTVYDACTVWQLCLTYVPYGSNVWQWCTTIYLRPSVRRCYRIVACSIVCNTPCNTLFQTNCLVWCTTGFSILWTIVPHHTTQQHPIAPWGIPSITISMATISGKARETYTIPRHTTMY